MTDSNSRILQALEGKPGQKASELAVSLSVDRQVVNSALHGPLKGKVRQDKEYRWYLKGSSGIDKEVAGVLKRLDTPLSRLCRYYLDCLSHDDLGGVSEIASSKYGEPSYVELTALRT